jgi:hypothetical protein
VASAERRSGGNWCGLPIVPWFTSHAEFSNFSFSRHDDAIDPLRFVCVDCPDELRRGARGAGHEERAGHGGPGQPSRSEHGGSGHQHRAAERPQTKTPPTPPSQGGAAEDSGSGRQQTGRPGTEAQATESRTAAGWGPLCCSTFRLSPLSPAGRGTVEPGWSLGVLAVGCALLSLRPGLARKRNRSVAKVHRFVGYQALESISRGVYRPSSSEIRLIRLSVIPSLSRARRRGNLPAPTATEMRLKKSSGI